MLNHFIDSYNQIQTLNLVCITQKKRLVLQRDGFLIYIKLLNYSSSLGTVFLANLRSTGESVNTTKPIIINSI